MPYLTGVFSVRSPRLEVRCRLCSRFQVVSYLFIFKCAHCVWFTFEIISTGRPRFQDACSLLAEGFLERSSWLPSSRSRPASHRANADPSVRLLRRRSPSPPSAVILIFPLVVSVDPVHRWDDGALREEGEPPEHLQAVGGARSARCGAGKHQPNLHGAREQQSRSSIEGCSWRYVGEAVYDANVQCQRTVDGRHYGNCFDVELTCC